MLTAPKMKSPADEFPPMKICWDCEPPTLDYRLVSRNQPSGADLNEGTP